MLPFYVTTRSCLGCFNMVPDEMQHYVELQEAAAQARFLDSRQRFDIWLELATPDNHGAEGDEVFQVSNGTSVEDTPCKHFQQVSPCMHVLWVSTHLLTASADETPRTCTGTNRALYLTSVYVCNRYQASACLAQVLGELVTGDGRIAASASRPCLVKQRYWVSRTFRSVCWPHAACSRREFSHKPAC